MQPFNTFLDVLTPGFHFRYERFFFRSLFWRDHWRKESNWKAARRERVFHRWESPGERNYFIVVESVHPLNGDTFRIFKLSCRIPSAQINCPPFAFVMFWNPCLCEAEVGFGSLSQYVRPSLNCRTLERHIHETLTTRLTQLAVNFKWVTHQRCSCNEKRRRS